MLRRLTAPSFCQSMVKSMPLGISLSAVLLSAATAPANPTDEFRKGATRFFEQHCMECHDADVAKGGLNLEKLQPSMAGKEQTDLWTAVFDRVKAGEMPPAKQPRPAAAELEQFLSSVSPRLSQADKARREVVQRRLNRIEYENTICDLLAVNVEVKDLLPADQQAGGFDNNGEALALSAEQMQGYLDAARVAVKAAIFTTPRPETKTVTVDSLKEVQRYIDTGDYGFVDGRIISYTTTDTDYSKISTREYRTPVAGRYRYRFQAAAHNTQDTQYFSINASNFAGVAAYSKMIGYYEVGPEPKMFEIETYLEPKYALQFFPQGFPGYVKKVPGMPYRGVGFGKVEITGPIIDQWPPESHTRLLGEIDVNKGTLQDAEMVLRRFMPRAYRRPVQETEAQRYVTLVSKQLDAGRPFLESLQGGLVAVLCSPGFIYLNEVKVPDAVRVSDLELASRLSYFLWSSQPDATLLEVAAKGGLKDRAQLEAQVERMLKDPKAESFVKNFTGQWLKLRQINETVPDERLYRKFNEILRISMVWETEGFFRHLLTKNLSIANFLDSDFALLNQRLVEHYGIDAKEVQGLELRPVALPKDSVRGGVLTQAAVLKVTANGTTTSPVMRGVWVLENILGQHVPPPPPNTAGIEPDIRGAETVREQLDKHRNVESCSACHKKIDPPGFALESFDPIGDYRANYARWVVHNEEKGYGSVKEGAPVDASGNLASGEKFADIREFKKLLMNQQEAFSHCLTEKLMTYATGRGMGFSDREALHAIVKQAASKGNGLRTLVHEIAASDLFAAP
ncbi:DUF1592 domain-containing protein [Roseimicrobium gellanilyticum]|nr:DUF1592 domain-containing protein [Roseimicrobium gellanilyticum]